MLHYRKNRIKAHKLNKRDKNEQRQCPFCDISQVEEIVDETKTMRVLRNRVSYDVFDGFIVRDHLMVVPVRHCKSLVDLTDQEKIDYVSLVGKYEQFDYSVYSRGVDNTTRSVEHVHTHLLKVPGHRVKALVYLSKPYFVWHLGQHPPNSKLGIA